MSYADYKDKYPEQFEASDNNKKRIPRIGKLHGIVRK